MKRTITTVFALALSLGFYACSGTDSGGKGVCDGTVDPISGDCIGGDNNSNNTNNTNNGNNTNNTNGSNNANNSDPWADTDNDGFLDRFDNCAQIENADQADLDGDGVGDPCDNCVDAANFVQTDTDADGIGDACDPDSEEEYYDVNRDDDMDGTPDAMDNCGGLANPDQLDTDMDALGDACDNCPTIANYDQTDTDMNGEGDACSTVPQGMICGNQTSDFQIVDPNIYMLLDRSGSMGTDGMNQAIAALDSIADSLAGDVRFGFGTFQTGSCPGLEHRLDMGTHAAGALKASWAGLGPGGGTPTAGSMWAVRTQNRVSEGGDMLDALRAKAVVLMTDGEPNACEQNGSPTQEAAAFAAAGIPVYVIGFKFGGNESTLNSIAQAGGTDAPPNGGDRFYTANNTAQLVAALQNIATAAISCQYVLDMVPQDPSKIWVDIEGNPVAREATNGFSFDAPTNTLTLNGASCNTLRMIDPMAGNNPLTITLGCATPCTPTEEVCDYQDNNCDGVIDEGCEGCEPEICDGIDNDCDTEIDEGCPNCLFDGETCTTDAECCNNACNNGVCGPPCRPPDATCLENSDCCGGICAKSGGDVGVCIQG